MTKPEVYTTDEVAIILDLSPRRIRQAAETFGIAKHGRDYYYTHADIELIRERIGMVGRPLEVS